MYASEEMIPVFSSSSVDPPSQQQQEEQLAAYRHIHQNEFFQRKHKKQKDEDIAVCVCKYDASNPESACGERCLNLLTSTECAPGFCPCGVFCKNQRFQRCEYAKTKLFKTEGRGWGLLADENMKAGQFIIEYCGEVISWKEARRRSQTYEIQGLKDAYIICLNAAESIDATAKGSHARFINHSCQPNCETRKWNVLGETRVGIFAKQDISVGTELGYDYNFEWYGGNKVRCLCGAASCTGFLGAKSRGFQEDTYLWEDDDDRYSVENIPLYDSGEDEPFTKLLKSMDSLKPGTDADGKNDYAMALSVGVKSEPLLESTSLVVQPLESVLMEDVAVNIAPKTEESKDTKLYLKDTQQAFPQKNAMVSRIRSNSACRNYHIGPGPVPRKRSQLYSDGKLKNPSQKQVDAKHVAQLLASKEARVEILRNEELKREATSQLSSLYDEIRPAIEEHERDNQDSVATSVAEKWIEASCLKLKAEFDMYSSIIKNVACTPKRTLNQVKPSDGNNSNEVKYLGF
ncbi:histone-lysine N-methyltransferase ASHH1-like [Mangifera indica]|uniref:histone-lysine N-methyltransferase ASHH1-like n=1 Tax=Mangifera indica TaxID=29780 RepID=UPI001CF98019|nr:histone-lysine N-methyltransferase ASHH1-like [Mangifera indica]XP_044511973.1 histone-lysine N-methyltransferase ASHH1-like [Mangifera indica]